jgi:hypothetical protein
MRRLNITPAGAIDLDWTCVIRRYVFEPTDVAIARTTQAAAMTHGQMILIITL